MSEYQTFPSYPTITRQLPARQLVSLPAVGILGLVTRAWLWWLRRYLNRDRYKLTIKGRSAKRPELRGYGGSIKLKNARRWGLYIDDKMGSKLREYNRAIGAHPERSKVERLTAEATHRSELLEEHHQTLMTVRQRLEDTRNEVAAVKLAATRDTNKSHAAIDRIWSELNGSEWNADTTERIAAHVRALGYEIGEPGEPAAAVKGGQR